MRRVFLIATAAAGIGMLVCVSAFVRARGETERARRELRTAISANNFLRAALGNMTAAIADKDKEIDRLAQLSCAAREARAASTARAARQKTRPKALATTVALRYQ